MPERRTRSVEEITDPLLGALSPVPRAAPGVCRICHGAPRAGYGECLSCRRTTSQVSSPTSLVVPISLYAIPSQLHAILWGYKNTSDQAVRGRQVVQVAAIVGRFLHQHRACIAGVAGTHFDAITVVPSSRGRPGSHPLEQAIGLLPSLASMLAPLLRPGADPIGEERHASDHAFEALKSATGRSVLIVDDTFTTGARVQSAASALHSAGAHVIAALVVGRVMRPDFSEESDTLWEHARSQSFTFAACCLEE